MRTPVPVSIFAIAILLSFNSCAQKNKSATFSRKSNSNHMSESTNLDTITFGGGCFWCTEAIVQRLRGVISVESGYSGGKISNPTYKEVCSGLTGHAECTQIVYDRNQIRLEEI